MTLKKEINIERLPTHIAIIMDGNGRWAKKKGLMRMFGHESGVKTVKTITTESASLGVKYLTVYAFSTENWNRPKLEVSALMKLLVKTIKGETGTLMDNNIRLQAIGNLEQLPKDCKGQLDETINATKDNTGLTLILALSYGAQWDIVQSIKAISKKVKDNEISLDAIDNELVKSNLTTAAFPNPELLIRTSGEERISNFLLWEIAYAELYFTETLWPDFGKEDLYKAILSYQNRERRFGKTSEQITQKES